MGMLISKAQNSLLDRIGSLRDLLFLLFNSCAPVLFHHFGNEYRQGYDQDQHKERLRILVQRFLVQQELGPLVVVQQLLGVTVLRDLGIGQFLPTLL